MKTLIIKKPHYTREVFLCILFLWIGLTFSQNKATQVFSKEGISEVIINGDQIFEFDISTESNSDIKVTSISSGEYQNHFQVASKVKGNRLFVDLIQNPLKELKDDKRNAHKVISAKVELSIPKGLIVSVISDVGSVNVSGVYKKLNLNLEEGNCTIKATINEAIIKTTSGNIYAETSDAIIQTDSQRGLVDIPNDMFGFKVWKLTTVSGNINVKHIK